MSALSEVLTYSTVVSYRQEAPIIIVTILIIAASRYSNRYAAN